MLKLKRSRHGQQNWWRKNKWNVTGLVLTILTGLVLPFYFQYESDRSQTAATHILSTVQALQSTTVATLLPPSVACAEVTDVGSLLTQLPTHLKHASGQSYVRVIATSTCIGTIDVFIDGNPLVGAFLVGVATNYVPVSGNHTIQAAIVGKGIGAPAMTEMLKILPGMAYTIVASGMNPTTLALKVFLQSV